MAHRQLKDNRTAKFLEQRISKFRRVHCQPFRTLRRALNEKRLLDGIECAHRLVLRTDRPEALQTGDQLLIEQVNEIAFRLSA